MTQEMGASGSKRPQEPDVEQVARICHEANRAYCKSLGDKSQLGWADAPDWQRNSALSGVRMHLAALRDGYKPRPEASHSAWMAEKQEAGWSYGPTKDPEKKTHPCFVPFEELPAEQKMKDYLFAAICEAFWRASQDEAARHA